MSSGFQRHIYLAGDVGPVVLAAQVLKVLLQESAHLNDAVSHALDLTQPLLVQLGVVHDRGSDTGTVNRRARVQRAHKDLDLGLDALLLLRGGSYERESTNTLTVQTLNCEETLVYLQS
jgi:hypothetical protein